MTPTEREVLKNALIRAIGQTLRFTPIYRIAEYGGGRWFAERREAKRWLLDSPNWEIIGTFQTRAQAVQAINENDRDDCLIGSRRESGTLRYENIRPQWELGGIKKNPPEGEPA